MEDQPKAPNRVEMSMPDSNSQPQTDPPQPSPGFTEDDAPRDAVFLTEAQEIRKRINMIGIHVQALNYLVAAIAVAVIYYAFKSGPKGDISSG